MYYNITAHKSSSSNSSSLTVISYLEKENKIPDDNGLILKESFFNSDYDSNKLNEDLNSIDVISSIDNNRGTQNHDSSNFYMLNISPSDKELEHMKNISIENLEKRNIKYDNNPPASNIYYNEQLDQLMKMQIKLYIKDVMVEYANNFNREIYIDENKLPTVIENKKLNEETDKLYYEHLKIKDIDLKISTNEKIAGDKYITVENCKIISENKKSKEVEIILDDKTKGIVNIPNALIYEQENKTLKVLESVYNNKKEEILNKNLEKEIQYKFTNTKIVSINNEQTKVYNFELKDKRFKEPLSFSVQEKDLKIKDKKFIISEHLNNEKVNGSLRNAVEKEYSHLKTKIYNDLAKDKGFDLSKRPLTEKDLLWYGKIERKRTYKHTDLSVKHNKEVSKKIAEVTNSKKPNLEKLQELQNSLIKDKVTKEIIKEGNTKGGLQYHSHVIVSRHDKTMLNPRNKISLSPVSNQKESLMNNGAKVGFNRKNFAERIEKVFDSKFEYNRPEKDKFIHINNANISNKALNMTKSKAKQFLLKHTGLSELKSNISPVQTIRKEIGLTQVPTQLPKGIVDLAVKGIKKVISQGIEI